MAGLLFDNYLWPDGMNNEKVADKWELLGRKNPMAYEKESRDWIAKNLGDVPRRHTAEQWTPEQLAGWAKAVCAPYEPNRIPDYFGETVPVESLGRERNDFLITIGQQEATNNVEKYRRLLEEEKNRGPVEWVPK